ncbi:hypothetical protein [Streptomyces sp. NPDC001604]|uniref:hypothetical protein n=1 Tax=Streptomyces sp. NPDC001604 TaxID=3364593 RepID=UPI0036A48BC0
MAVRELNPVELKRIPEGDVSSRDIKWLAEVDIDRAALEERWGSGETACDSLAEWLCFAFSPAEGEAFLLLRETEHPPTPQFGLSVTSGLFSASIAGRIVEALGIAGARVIKVSADAPPPHAFTTQVVSAGPGLRGSS